MLLTQSSRGGKSQWQKDLQDLLMKIGGIERSNMVKSGLHSRTIEYKGRTFCFVSKAKEDLDEPS
jgi:hypothetical protein